MNNQEWGHSSGDPYRQYHPPYQQPYSVHQHSHDVHHYPAEPGLVDYKPVAAHAEIDNHGMPGGQGAVPSGTAAPVAQYPNGFDAVQQLPEEQDEGRPPGSQYAPASATLDTSEVLDAEDGDDMDEDHVLGQAREEGTPTGPDGTPAPIPIVCNNIKGHFDPVTSTIHCFCPQCTSAAESSGRHSNISPNDFERHCGKAPSARLLQAPAFMKPACELGSGLGS